LEVLHLIIQKRTKELQRKDPEVDVTNAIKRTIMSLIRREESIFEEMMRRSPRDQTSNEEVLSESVENESLTLEDSEEDKITRYMRIVRNEIGRSLSDEEKKVIIKAMRAIKETRKEEDRAPPWRKDKDRPEKPTSPFDAKEKDKADERFKTLKHTLTNKIAKPEASESSSSDEYTYEDDSEGDFQPAKEGTPITTTIQTRKELKIANVPMSQEKSHTEEKRQIPVIRTVKKEKSPTKQKEKVETYYFPYDQETKIYQFMPFEDIPTTKEDFRKKEKEWTGFERALNKIGLDKEEVLDRIKKGLLPYKSEKEQRRKCDEVYQKATWTGRKRDVSPPPRIMTAAKTKTKRPDDKPKEDERRRTKEKATSSKPEKTEKESYKPKTKEVKPPMSTSPGPCTGECKEICQEGPKWERCGMTCKVQTEHVSKDCRCKRHEKKDRVEEETIKPIIDPILEACRKGVKI